MSDAKPGSIPPSRPGGGGPVDSRLWLQAFVEHARHDLQEGTTEACPSGRAGGQLHAAVARERLPATSCLPSGGRLERLLDEVGLTEHAVQMQVEAR